MMVGLFVDELQLLGLAPPLFVCLSRRDFDLTIVFTGTLAKSLGREKEEML